MTNSSHHTPAAGLDLSTVVKALRRGWRLVAVATVITVAATALFTFLRSPVYRAEGVVLVDVPARSGGGGAAALSLFSMGQAVRSLSNEVELLRQSDLLAERVALRLSGPRAVAGSPEIKELVDLLRGEVVFEPVSDQVDMIQISTLNHDAALAARIVNEYAEVYQGRGREAMRSSATGSREFLEGQESQRRAELAEVESSIEAYLTISGAVDLDSEGQEAVSQAAQIDVQVEQATVDLATARTELASIRGQLAQIEPNLQNRVASSADREIDALQQQIAALEVQAADYYAQDPTLRGDEARSPELAALRRRIDGMAARVERLSAQYVGEVAAVGGANGDDATGLTFAGQLRREASKTQIRVQGLQAQLAALQSRRGAVDGRIRKLPQQTVRLAQLRRQQQVGEQAYEFVVARLQEARLAEASEPGYVEVVRSADVPTVPVEPRPIQNLALGTMLGLMLGVGLSLLRYTTDLRVRSSSDVRDLGQTSLASVPSFTEFVQTEMGGAETTRVGHHDIDTVVAAGLHPFSPVTEAFRRVRTAVKFSTPDRQTRTLLVTSGSPGEGKSTTALGLAVSSVLAGRRVLYLDADLRKPTGHLRLGLSQQPGLSDLLFSDVAPSEIDWEPYRLNLDGVASEGGPGFYALTAGRRVPNPTELLGSNQMSEVLAAAADAFDLVVVDSAPVLPVSDSLLLAEHCDAALIVARAARTTGPALARAAELLGDLGEGSARMIGIVLNDAPAERSYGGYKYGYGYGYGYGDGADLDWEPAGNSAPSGDGTAVAPLLHVPTTNDPSLN